MTRIIQEYTDLGLRDAKDCTDRVLQGEAVVLAVATEEQAQDLAERLREIGAVAETGL